MKKISAYCCVINIIPYFARKYILNFVKLVNK